MEKRTKRNEGVLLASISAVVLFAAVTGGVLYSQYTPTPKVDASAKNFDPILYANVKKTKEDRIRKIESDIESLPDYSNEKQNARKELERAKLDYSGFMRRNEKYVKQ